MLEALTPGGLAYSGGVREKLVGLGAQLLGSRGSIAGVPSHEHNALFLVATDEDWERVAGGLEVDACMSELAGFVLPNAVALAPGERHDGAWEATLHPDVRESTPTSFIPVGEVEREAFVNAVTEVGGAVTGDFRAVSGLTTVPVRLPGAPAARQLGTYNPLRALRPIARVTPR